MTIMSVTNIYWEIILDQALFSMIFKHWLTSTAIPYDRLFYLYFAPEKKRKKKRPESFKSFLNDTNLINGQAKIEMRQLTLY